MHVLCVTTGLHEITARALQEHAPQAEIVTIAPLDLMGYWRILNEHWTGTDDLMVIEHDIEIGPDTVTSLETCPHDWCAFGYWLVNPENIEIGRSPRRLIHSLGCTKYSAKAQRLFSLEALDCHRWDTLDVQIAVRLLPVLGEPHDHGDVPHHHRKGLLYQAMLSLRP
jgi:hypothetical protein